MNFFLSYLWILGAASSQNDDTETVSLNREVASDLLKTRNVLAYSAKKMQHSRSGVCMQMTVHSWLLWPVCECRQHASQVSIQHNSADSELETQLLFSVPASYDYI